MYNLCLNKLAIKIGYVCCDRLLLSRLSSYRSYFCHTLCSLVIEHFRWGCFAPHRQLRPGQLPSLPTPPLVMSLKRTTKKSIATRSDNALVHLPKQQTETDRNTKEIQIQCICTPLLYRYCCCALPLSTYARTNWRTTRKHNAFGPIYRMDGRITRSSAIAEGPRDVSCQLKSCQLSRNSAETTCTTSPEQIEVMKLERCIASRGKNLTRKEPKTKKNDTACNSNGQESWSQLYQPWKWKRV